MSALSAVVPQDSNTYRPAHSEDAKQLSKTQTKLFSARREGRPPPPPFDVLDPNVAAAISDRWQEPCEGAFEYLAAKHPANLLRLLKGDHLDVADLTFAAEIAGRIDKAEEVVPALQHLLTHSSAVVREGAIYGLAHHLNDAIRAQLQEMSREDPSAAVRTAATGVVEG